MSLHALADGVTLQRLFTWPFSSAGLALGLGSLDQEVAALSDLLSGTQQELMTSHPLVRATLVTGEIRYYLIVVNRDSQPRYANIRLVPQALADDHPEGSSQERRPLHPLITAAWSRGERSDTDDNAPQAILSRDVERDVGIISVALQGWDALIIQVN